jgi:hypothetical protein
LPLKANKKKAGSEPKSKTDKESEGKDQSVHHYPLYSVESIVQDVKRHKLSRFNHARCAMCGF